MLLTDVDGVLTDGKLHFDPSGNELKVFHVHDGAGLAYWHRAGHMSGFISGRSSKVVEVRAQELRVHEVHLGHTDKAKVLQDILQRLGLLAEEVAYIGDDLLDLPVMTQVGVAISVPNGRVEVQQQAHFVTKTAGGHGALREVVELLLQAQDKWEAVVQRGGRA